MYRTSVYFGRLVPLAIDDGPMLHGATAAVCEMSDVLRGMALKGAGRGLAAGLQRGYGR